MIPFLIRQENLKYSRKAGGLKFDLLHFGWFNLYQDPFFEEIMNLATELLHLAWACAISKMVIGDKEGVGKCSPIVMIQLWSRLDFKGESISE